MKHPVLPEQAGSQVGDAEDDELLLGSISYPCLVANVLAAPRDSLKITSSSPPAAATSGATPALWTDGTAGVGSPLGT